MTPARELTPTTWRRKAGIITWTFQLPLPEGMDPRQALRHSAQQVARALDGFARPTAASWTSASTGEDALEQDLAEEPLRALAQADLPDPVGLSLDLDLLCLGSANEEVLLRRAADLWLELEEDALSLVLSLDVDIYAWRSWGQERDNRLLAERNGPRLATFLKRMQHELGAVLVDIDAQDYRGQVDATGFHPPDASF